MVQQQEQKIDDMTQKNRLQEREIGQKQDQYLDFQAELQSKTDQYIELNQIFDNLQNQQKELLDNKVVLEGQIKANFDKIKEMEELQNQLKDVIAQQQTTIAEEEKKYNTMYEIFKRMNKKMEDDESLGKIIENKDQMIQKLGKNIKDLETNINTKQETIACHLLNISDLEEQFKLEKLHNENELENKKQQFLSTFQELQLKSQTESKKSQSLMELVDTLQAVKGKDEQLKQSQNFQKQGVNQQLKELLKNKSHELANLKEQNKELQDFIFNQKRISEEKDKLYEQNLIKLSQSRKEDQIQFKNVLEKAELEHKMEIQNQIRDKNEALSYSDDQQQNLNLSVLEDNLQASLVINNQKHKQLVQEMNIQLMNNENEIEQLKLEYEILEKKFNDLEQQLKAQKDLNEKLLEKYKILELEIKQIDNLKAQHAREIEDINNKYNPQIDQSKKNKENVTYIENKLNTKINDLQSDMSSLQEKFQNQKEKSENLEQKYETQYQINKKSKLIINEQSEDFEKLTVKNLNLGNQLEVMTSLNENNNVKVDEQKELIKQQAKKNKALKDQNEYLKQKNEELMSNIDQIDNNLIQNREEKLNVKRLLEKQKDDILNQMHQQELKFKKRDFDLQREEQKVIDLQDKVASLTKDIKEQKNSYSLQISELKDQRDMELHDLKQLTSTEVAQIRKNQHVEIQQMRSENQEYHIKMKLNDKEILEVKEKSYKEQSQAEIELTKLNQRNVEKVYTMENQISKLNNEREQNMKNVSQVQIKNSQLAQLVDELNAQVIQGKMLMNNELNNIRNNIATMRTMLSKTIVEVKDGSKAANALLHININLQKMKEQIDKIEIKEYKPSHKVSDLVVGNSSEQQMKILLLQQQLKAYEEKGVTTQDPEKSIYFSQEKEIKDQFNNDVKFTNDQHQKSLVQNLKQLLVEKDTELGKAKKEATYLRLQNQDANVISDLESKVKKQYEVYTLKSQQVQALEEQVTALKIELKTKNYLLDSVKPKIQSKDGSLNQASEKIQCIMQNMQNLEKEQITSLRKLDEKQQEILQKDRMIQKYKSLIKNMKIRVIKLLYLHLNRNGSIEDVIGEMENSKDFGTTPGDTQQQQLTIPAFRSSAMNSVSESQNDNYTQATSQYKYRSTNKPGGDILDHEKEIQLHTQRIQQLERLNKSFDNNPQDRISNEFSHDRLPQVVSSQKFQRRNNSQDLRLQPIENAGSYSNALNPYGLVDLNTNQSQQRFQTIDESSGSYGITPINESKAKGSLPGKRLVPAKQNNFVRKQVKTQRKVR